MRKTTFPRKSERYYPYRKPTQVMGKRILKALERFMAKELGKIDL